MKTGATSKGSLGLKFDRSVLFLILANLFTILVAVLARWNLFEVLWIYWGQNVIIGFYNWRRILCLKQFSTAGLATESGRTLAPTRANQRHNASFFAMHYGFFHVGYLSLLCEKGTADLTGLGLFSVATCIVLFAISSHSSFRHTLERDASSMPSLLGVMFFPYVRVFPMHLTVMIGGACLGAFGGHHAKPTTAVAVTLTLVLFLILKTGADVLMHLIEHRDPLAILPLNIHLTHRQEPDKAARPVLAALTSDGFVTAGSWHIAECPVFHVDLMVHPTDGMLAVVESMSSASVGSVLTLHTLYPDAQVVSFSNDKTPAPKLQRPGFTLTQAPQSDPEALVAQARAQRPKTPCLPVSARDAPRVYERLYADEVLFRKAHGA